MVICSNWYFIEKSRKSSLMNCGPLSVTRVFGIPNLAKWGFSFFMTDLFKAVNFEEVRVIVHCTLLNTISFQIQRYHNRFLPMLSLVFHFFFLFIV